MFTYSQARMIAEQRNQYLSKLDHVVRIMRREYLLVQRYTIEGRLRTFFEPINEDRKECAYNY